MSTLLAIFIRRLFDLLGIFDSLFFERWWNVDRFIAFELPEFLGKLVVLFDSALQLVGVPLGLLSLLRFPNTGGATWRWSKLSSGPRARSKTRASANTRGRLACRPEG